MPSPRRDPLRFVTYLAPSIPVAYFRAVAEQVAGSMGRAAELAVETSLSGPSQASGEPFSGGDADAAFVCAPSVPWLRATAAALPVAAPVFGDPRGSGRPVYYSAVVVAERSPIGAVDELFGALWAVNDESSLSGYGCVVRAIPAEARRVVRAGSHTRSMEFVAAGKADAAAIDSTVWALAERAGRTRGLRVVDWWGPFAVQPVVVAERLDEAVRAAILGGLVGLADHVAGREALALAGALRFVPVDPRTYASDPFAEV